MSKREELIEDNVEADETVILHKKKKHRSNSVIYSATTEDIYLTPKKVLIKSPLLNNETSKNELLLSNSSMDSNILIIDRDERFETPTKNFFENDKKLKQIKELIINRLNNCSSSTTDFIKNSESDENEDKLNINNSNSNSNSNSNTNNSIFKSIVNEYIRSYENNMENNIHNVTNILFKIISNYLKENDEETKISFFNNIVILGNFECLYHTIETYKIHNYFRNEANVKKCLKNIIQTQTDYDKKIEYCFNKIAL
jgi:hypothetical protein